MLPLPLTFLFTQLFRRRNGRKRSSPPVWQNLTVPLSSSQLIPPRMHILLILCSLTRTIYPRPTRHHIPCMQASHMSRRNLWTTGTCSVILPLCHTAFHPCQAPKFRDDRPLLVMHHQTEEVRRVVALAVTPLLPLLAILRLQRLHLRKLRLQRGYLKWMDLRLSRLNPLRRLPVKATLPDRRILHYLSRRR